VQGLRRGVCTATHSWEGAKSKGEIESELDVCTSWHEQMAYLGLRAGFIGARMPSAGGSVRILLRGCEKESVINLQV
jgi:hypothetical protein